MPAIDLIDVETFNRFLPRKYQRCDQALYFPSEYKEAFITLIVKKAGLDTTDVCSYQPISNLSVVLKLLERIVVRQLMAYLSTLWFPTGSSTETAVLQVMSELLQAVDRGEVGAVCSRPSASTATCIDDFGRISSVGGNTFVAVLSDNSSPICCAVCHGDQFWNRCCLFCTPLTSFN